MEISAIVKNAGTDHIVTVRTGDNERPLSIPANSSGPGSSVNGGELLMLALATCYCNDLYREAARLGITLNAVEVEAIANFPGVGLAASDIRYLAKVSSHVDPVTIADLLQQTDAVAEVHNTVRSGASVVLVTESSGGP
jgi:organic hydroperoxide reductase OsmC/OhrA